MKKHKYILLILLIAFFFTKVQAQVANFSASDTIGCYPELFTVSFINTSTGADLEFQWDFGNGTTSSAFQPTATYNTPGSYTVRLIVKSGANADTLTRVDYIHYFNGPTAGLTALSDTIGCIPLSIVFEDRSSPGDTAIESWEWDFDDGLTSILQNPVHTFTNAGTPAISLKVTDFNGCADQVIKQNYIIPTERPVADFSSENHITCNESLEVTFINESTGYGELNYEWNFGDGASSTSTNPVHTYNGLGVYNVQLIVTDQNNCTDTLLIEEFVQLIEISASFNIDNDTLCPGQQIPITNNTVGVSNFIWNFGDGTILTDENPQHAYTDSGKYIISLAVYSDAECFAFNSDTVYVEYIKAYFTTDTNYSCQVPFTVHYTNASQNAASYQWHFGNNKTSTLSDPENIFELTQELEDNATASYTDTLFAISPSGCMDTYYQPTENIQIILPQAKFTPNDEDYESPDELSGCAPHAINFSNTSSFNSPYESIDAYFWDFGDGETSNQADFNKVYTDTNQYEVSLIVTTTFQCVDTFITTVKVGNPQHAEFSLVGPDVICASDSAVFLDASTDADFVNGWKWLFGDGTTSNLQNPFHFFRDTGYMSVGLIAYHNGCPGDTTFADSVVQIMGPIASFNYILNCEQPYDYNFTADMKDIASFQWDFGDGNTNNTDTSLLYTYAVKDDYEVKLTTANSNTACSFEYTDLIKIRNLQASFTQNKYIGCPNLSVQFDATASTDFTDFQYNGESGTFLWYFGDAPGRFMTTDSIVNHIYETKGEFPVQLVLKSENGCVDTAKNKVKVYQPEAGFTADTTLGCTPMSVQFTNTTASDTSIASYNWYFGDESFSSQENPSHHFNDIGIFTIQLKVTDKLGCQDTLIMDDMINSSKPKPSFTTPDLFLCTNESIAFASTSEGAIDQYEWNFGDGEFSNAQNPQHAFTDSGYFSVSLHLTDDFGCDSTLTKTDYIHVQAKPETDFTADNTTGACWPATIHFTDQTNSKYVNKWLWNFGDGSSGSSIKNPTKNFNLPGSFDVSLQVETTYGCKDTIVKEGYITIIGAFADIVAPDTVCPYTITEFDMQNQQSVESFTWLFSDGSTASTDPAYHTFTDFGEQKTSLILYTNDASCPPKQINDTIYVHHLEAGFTISAQTGCIPFTITLNDTSVNVNTLLWSFGDGNTSDESNLEHTYPNEGKYLIREIVKNEFNCSDTAEVEITAHPLPVITTSNDILICAGDTVYVEAFGAKEYSWAPSQFVTDATIQNPGVFPAYETHFFVTGTDSVGCTNYDSVLIQVQQKPVITSINSDTTVVIGEEIVLFATFDQGKTFFWSPKDKLEYPDSLSSRVKIPEDISYYFTVIDSNLCFTVTRAVNISVREVYSVDVPTAFTPNNDGNNDIIFIRGWGIFELVEFRVYNRLGKVVFVSNDINEGWDGNFNGEKQPSGTYGYTVRIKSYDNQIREKTGSFLLIR